MTQIRKLERIIIGHSCEVFEVNKEISEIKNISVESNDGHLCLMWRVYYRSGVIKELHGGIVTVTYNAEKL